MADDYSDLIEIRRGTDASFTVICEDENGAPMDVTGYTFISQIRPAEDSTTLTLEPTIEITDAAAGELTISFAAADTIAVAAGEYLQDIMYEEAGTRGHIPGWRINFYGTVSKFT